MNLIELQIDEPKPQSKIIADQLLAKINASISERVFEHVQSFKTFWGSTETPDEILAEMGTNAQKFLTIAGENINHIGRLASIAGKELSDFITIENYNPRRSFIFGANGVVTLAPPMEGFDAWGVAITEPETTKEP